MNMSKHAQKRLQQRSIPKKALEIVMKYGRVTDAPGGTCKIFFGNKEYLYAMKELKQQMKTLEQARGGIVIWGGNQAITVYKQFNS